MEKSQRIWQIAYPDQIRSHDHMPGPKRFLDSLIDYIRERGDIAVVFPQVHVPWTPRGITLNFHMTGYAPNTYHYKESFLKNWVQIDRLGYTGFHSWNVARDIMPINQARLQKIPKKLADYVASKQSKYDQSASPFSIDRPYLFFPLQKPQDETSLFARFRVDQIVNSALPWCVLHNKKLVIKRHPFCHSARMEQWLQSLSGNEYIVVTDGAVADLVQNAEAVLTVNSSVGFEALLQNKPVLAFGLSEYSSFATEVHDLKTLPSLLNQAIEKAGNPQKSIEEFSASCLFDSNDAEDIASFYATLTEEYDRTASSAVNVLQPVPEWLDLSESGNADPHVLHGFSYAEEWGRWTNALHSALVFSSDTAFQANISLALYAYVKDIYPLQFFDLVWNHQVVLRNIACQNKHSFPGLTAKIQIERGINILSLIPHNPIHPVNLGTDFDVRNLGLRVEKVLFERIGS